MNRSPYNNYTGANYDDPFSSNLAHPGVVMRKKQNSEIMQNKNIFQYYMPPLQQAPCLAIGMRPEETKHSILGVNVCDALRNTYANPETLRQPTPNAPHTNGCNLDPFIPSWSKYRLGINSESDLKNIIRKISCEPDAYYLPSTTSTMYARGGMPSRDATMESGRYNFEYHAQRNIIPSLFREDTRQTRMGKIN